jgi:hypothetical protein
LDGAFFRKESVPQARTVKAGNPFDEMTFIKLPQQRPAGAPFNDIVFANFILHFGIIPLKSKLPEILCRP